MYSRCSSYRGWINLLGDSRANICCWAPIDPPPILDLLLSVHYVQSRQQKDSYTTWPQLFCASYFVVIWLNTTSFRNIHHLSATLTKTIKKKSRFWHWDPLKDTRPQDKVPSEIILHLNCINSSQMIKLPIELTCNESGPLGVWDPKAAACFLFKDQLSHPNGFQEYTSQ